MGTWNLWFEEDKAAPFRVANLRSLVRAAHLVNILGRVMLVIKNGNKVTVFQHQEQGDLSATWAGNLKIITLFAAVLPGSRGDKFDINQQEDRVVR